MYPNAFLLCCAAMSTYDLLGNPGYQDYLIAVVGSVVVEMEQDFSLPLKTSIHTMHCSDSARRRKSLLMCVVKMEFYCYHLRMWFCMQIHSPEGRQYFQPYFRRLSKHSVLYTCLCLEW